MLRATATYRYMKYEKHYYIPLRNQTLFGDEPYPMSYFRLVYILAKFQ